MSKGSLHIQFRISPGPPAIIIIICAGGPSTNLEGCIAVVVRVRSIVVGAKKTTAINLSDFDVLLQKDLDIYLDYNM